MQDRLNTELRAKLEILINAGKTSREIAKIMERSPTWVSVKCAAFGIKVNNYTSKHVKEQIRTLYSSGVSARKICDILKVDKQIVWKFSKDLPKQGNRVHKVKDEFLDRIGLEQAYFIGFMLADGYVHIPSNRLQISVATKDIQILHTFKSLLETSNPISTRLVKTTYGTTSISSLYIVSKRLTNRCKELLITGYETTKTAGLCKFPAEVESDPKLFLACLRGFVDGDGYVSRIGAKHKSMEIIATTEMCAYIKSNLITKFNVDSSLKKESRTNIDMHVLRFFGTNYNKLYELLKPFNYGLSRKFNL